MFFELHDEHKIGYKTLSEADLGKGQNTHQTHIGLSEHVLTFLPDRAKIIENSILVYGNSFKYLDVYFGKINNPDGTFRSPKIRTGDSSISVVSEIREIAKPHNNKKWFLLWFGLKSEQVVFVLFDGSSGEYDYISKLGLNLGARGAKALGDSELFDNLMKHLEAKINGETVLKELEVASQIGAHPYKRFKSYDIDRANQIFKEIGRKGEELVDAFLDAGLRNGEFSNYCWNNREKESGLPYDFQVQLTNGNLINLDVKTTNYDFNQQMILSSQEIDFIANTEYEYHIYRVYKNGEQFFLRVCDSCKNIAVKINALTTDYMRKLSQIETDLRTAKFAVSPSADAFNFKPEILLT